LCFIGNASFLSKKLQPKEGLIIQIDKMIRFTILKPLLSRKAKSLLLHYFIPANVVKGNIKERIILQLDNAKA
jgi:hypothetical protein